MSNGKYKIVYIGAGSYRFAIPCAMNILDFAKEFNPIELWLVDIDAYSLSLIKEVVWRMLQLHRIEIEIHASIDRKLALPGADYVLISISVGIQKSEWSDIHIPLKFGIPQNTGDTVGPGGIFRGLRTIPVIAEILKDIKELCPNALILNYTNPQSTVMLSIYQTGPNVQSVGLCHEFFYLGSKKFGKVLKYCNLNTSTKKNFQILYGGLNHFSWITKFEYGEEDLYPMLRELADYMYKSGKLGRTFNFYLLKQSGYLTYVEDRHVAEFLPKYYNYFNHWDKPFNITDLRNVYRLHLERKFVYSLIKGLKKRRFSWIIKLFLRPTERIEKALLMAKDKERNIPRHHVCNVLNNGFIPYLPNNCVIEIPCYFKNEKIHKVKIGDLSSPIKDWVILHARNQQLVLNAALSGNPDDLIKALLADPMCDFIKDEEKIEALMMNMLYYQKEWLSNFSESVPKYSQLKKMKYFIEKKELSTKKLSREEKYCPNEHIRKNSWPYSA
ncbi:MAG: hypothetical protein ACFFDF_25130 [Candidatus Odinarchaeota archaeon]